MKTEELECMWRTRSPKGKPKEAKKIRGENIEALVKHRMPILEQIHVSKEKQR